MTEPQAPLKFADANASAVTPQLWIGGDLGTEDEQTAVGQLTELMDAGLTHLLDVRLEWDDTSFVAKHSPEVRYLHLGVADEGQQMPDEWFDRGTAFVLDALENEDAHVLVHCHAGINRGPSMGYAAMLALGWEPQDALTAITKARPIAWIDYSEDATDWWARRSGVDDEERDRLMKQVATWREKQGMAYRAQMRLTR